jgi:pimeloyl-ACP methyl ester carboxylesterase
MSRSISSRRPFRMLRSHFFQIAGARLHVLELGSPQAQPLFVLHYGGGGFGSQLPSRKWLDFAFPADGRPAYRVIFVDRLGYGLSDPLKDFAFPADFFLRERDHLAWLHKRLCAGQRAVLVGSSDGGSIALAYAAAYPKRCKAVMVDGAHAYYEDSMLLALDDMKRRFLHKFSLLRKPSEAAVVSTARAWFDVWYGLGKTRWSMLDELKSMQAPLLVLQGDRDGVVPDSHAEAIAQAAGGESTWKILENTGHLCPADSPDLYFQHLEKFLSRTPEAL